MTYVLFVPGLSGHKSIATQTPLPPVGTNYYAVLQTARSLKAPCARADFQNATNKFPTLSEMGLSVASEIEEMQDEYRDPGLIVASSVGAGVVLQALQALKPQYTLPHVIAFKPVFDPLDAITGALDKVPNGPLYLEKLKSGEIAALPLPVEATSASEDPGHFMLTQAHLDDQAALRLISNSTNSFALFAEKLAGRKMASMKIMIAEKDTVALSNMSAFKKAVDPHVQFKCVISNIPGTHSDEQSDKLAKEVHNRLFRIM